MHCTSQHSTTWWSDHRAFHQSTHYHMVDSTSQHSTTGWSDRELLRNEARVGAPRGTLCYSYVEFSSVQSFDRLGRRGTRGTKTCTPVIVCVTFLSFSIKLCSNQEGRIRSGPLPVFSAGCSCELFWHGQECPLSGVVHPACPLPTTSSPTPALQGALKGVFGEAVVCDMPEPSVITLMQIHPPYICRSCSTKKYK